MVKSGNTHSLFVQVPLGHDVASHVQPLPGRQRWPPAHVSAVPAWQVPFWQVSVPLHVLASAHDVLFATGVCLHDVTGSHE
jgi:hypothetical protein